jgi:hypothetical protein
MRLFRLTFKQLLGVCCGQALTEIRGEYPKQPRRKVKDKLQKNDIH